MTPKRIDTGPYYEEETHHHYILVGVAIVLSIVLHYALMKRVSNMRFDVTANVDQAVREQYEREPPSKIESIPEDPEQPLQNPFEGDVTTSPGVGIQAAVTELASKPDPSLSAPRVSDQALTVAREVPVQPPKGPEPKNVWLPRQEVISVVDKIVRDDIAVHPRIALPPIERVSMAPDYVPAVNISKIKLEKNETPPVPPVIEFDQGESPQTIATPETVEVETAPTPEAQTPEVTISRFGEKPSDISSFKPVDSRLMAKTTVFRPNDGSDKCYFKFEVAPREAAALPVVPKDIVFVQDASRSLAEERLYFCRKALAEAIQKLAAPDRFNIALFRENAEFCFDGWATPNKETIEQATTFINAMKSKGGTDVFESMKSILTLPRDPARPLIIVLVTDGKATTGLTKSSSIIGEFSKLNDNTSVFAIGTHGKANNYLLDMLTFCNRGSADIVTSGRWDIPNNISSMIEGCSRPVLGRVGVTTALASEAELFPLPSANLYADRTLEYYGSCPKDVTNLVVQVRGEGGGTKCDILFQMDLSTAETGGMDIKNGWARRKMHSLVGQYARDPSPELLDAMRKLSYNSGFPIPYQKEILK